MVPDNEGYVRIIQISTERLQLGSGTVQTTVSTQRLQLAISATDVTQKYIMNMEGSETWDEEQIEAFMHNRWLLMQELGDDYYRMHENNDSDGEDEEQALRRIEWEEEEEEAKKEQFRVIAEEEKRGYKMETVAELIEEESKEKQKLK